MNQHNRKQTSSWDAERKERIVSEQHEKPHLPPSLSILSFSLGSSGLWSCVTSSACSRTSDSLSVTPTTTAESPTCATYMCFPRITTTLAVVPDVLGRPVSVLGHSAVDGG